MASFKISGQMKVKTLKQNFKDYFGTSLRVYYHHHFADDDVTLASIRDVNAQGGEFDCGDQDIVGDFEEFMQELYGIEVQVASPDNSFLVDNDLKLCEIAGSAKPAEEAKKGRPTFVFNGDEYKIKGRLCHAIVKYWLSQNPNAALPAVQRTFNTVTDMYVAQYEVAMATTDSAGVAGGSYYIKPEDQLELKNCKVVVWNYWPERHFTPFMENVKKLGYEIVER